MRYEWIVGCAAIASSVLASAGAAHAGGGNTYVDPAAGDVALPAPAAPAPVSSVPEPGRVPLQIESAGPSQVVGLYVGEEWRGGRRHRYLAQMHQDLCRTPCQLFALPDTLELYMYGFGVVGRRVEVGVPPGGLRIRVAAPSSSGVVGGVVLTSFGGIALALGAIFLPVGLATDTAGLTVAGSVIGLAGIAMMVPGIALVAQPEGIVASGPPTAAPTHARAGATAIAFGAAPLRGGGAVTASLRF